jgi:hypothetical protein
MRGGISFLRVDRSFQTDARAERVRPDGRHRKRCLRADVFSQLRAQAAGPLR